ncbi:MAG: hypothetical protein FJ040_08560 [Chloroflexi bacterium]|nr:hypothetical protein [Chloroflexota bacterium]
MTTATTTACARQPAIRAPWLIDGTTSQHVGSGTGRVLYERWNAVVGSTIAQLTGTTAYPRYPTTRTIRNSAFEIAPLAVSNVGQRLARISTLPLLVDIGFGWPVMTQPNCV